MHAPVFKSSWVKKYPIKDREILFLKNSVSKISFLKTWLLCAQNGTTRPSSPSFFPSFLLSFLLSFLPTFLPFSFLPSFFPSFLPCFLSSFLRFFPHSFLPSFLRCCLGKVQALRDSRCIGQGSRRWGGVFRTGYSRQVTHVPWNTWRPFASRRGQRDWGRGEAIDRPRSEAAYLPSLPKPYVIGCFNHAGVRGVS